jgi:ribosomal-protein-alanine N-acetyltransferase
MTGALPVSSGVMFRLETERLLIRPWHPEEDRAALMVMTNDAEVMKFVHGGAPYTDEEVDGMFARQARNLADHGMCMGALVEKASGNVVGITGVQPLGDDLEIGWWLARDVWGRGYATEAGGAAMRHVLETLARPRVIAIIDPGNETSKRVVERLGMRLDGRYTGALLRHRMPEIVVDLFVKERGA